VTTDSELCKTVAKARAGSGYERVPRGRDIGFSESCSGGGVAGTYALVFNSQFPGGGLTAASKGNKGSVAGPTIPELDKSAGGGALTVQGYNDNITGRGQASNMAALHLPKLH
jgi:hypothetical protein